MHLTRILIASPVNQQPEILKRFALSLFNLDLKGVEASFLFIDDNNDPNSSMILLKISEYLSATIINAAEISASEKSRVYRTDIRHEWSTELINKVAVFKNNMIKYAIDNKFDYVFLVDSDILLNQKTLTHLIEQDTDVVSEIYWTSWMPGSPSFPQVWLYDNYTQYDVTENVCYKSNSINDSIKNFHDMLKKPGIYKVGGLGGCTLIKKEVLLQQVSFKRIPNISFAGEDRHFSIRAAVNGFELYVDTNYPAFHIYRQSDISKADEQIKMWGYNDLSTFYVK